MTPTRSPTPAGVNLQSGNLMSLHTTANCTMPSDERSMTGSATSTDCNAADNSNQGCGVSGVPLSYGADFNGAGGGWFAMQRGAATGIRAWFWSRDAADSAPLAVRYPLVGAVTGVSPDDSWGEPYAAFPMGSACNYTEHFNAHQFVFDLTFCVSACQSRAGNPLTAGVG